MPLYFPRTRIGPTRWTSGAAKSRLAHTIPSDPQRALTLRTNRLSRIWILTSVRPHRRRMICLETMNWRLGMLSGRIEWICLGTDDGCLHSLMLLYLTLGS